MYSLNIKPRTVMVINVEQANTRGMELYESKGLEPVIQEIFKRTDSWPKTVTAVHKAYNIKLSLDVRNIS